MNVTETRRRERHDIEAEHSETQREVAAPTERPQDPYYQCEAPGSKAERCEPGTREPTVLFKKQKSDGDGISIDDVRQWRIGDCWLLAPLGALALTPQGRQTIRDMIKENRDAHGNVLSYTVTFHDGDKLVAKKVWPGDLPRGALDVSRDVGNRAEIWPAVIEAAYARWRGNYAALHGGRPSVALEALTGRAATVLDPAKGGIVKLVSDAFAEGRPALVSTHGMGPLPCGVVPGHAYVVKAIESDGLGNRVLVLRNPWGPKEKTVRVPEEQWAQCFSTVTIGG